MSHIDWIQVKYPNRVAVETFDDQGGGKIIHLGFVMEEDNKKMRIKTCVDGSKDEWEEMVITKSRAIIKRMW